MTLSQTEPGMLRPGDGPIVRIGDDRRLEAVRRMVCPANAPEDGPARRFLAYAAESNIDLEHLWARLGPDGRVVHTVLAVKNPGRTTVLFSSAPRDHADVPSLAGVVAAALEAMGGRDFHLAQVLLEPEAGLEREAFRAAGFGELAHLSYLERSVSPKRRIPTTSWPDGVTIHRYAATMRAEMLEILAGTYEDTLDCPGLTGLRETNDILDGHLATGVFDPDLWWVLRENGRGIGTVLLSPSHGQRSVELVYLGLVPAARGRGLGRTLLRHGIAHLAGRRERRVTLAVDERNDPAIALYRGEGFRRVLRRVALVRSLREL